MCCRGPGARAVESALALDEEVEHPRQEVAPDPDPVVLDPDHGVPRQPREGQGDLPPAGVYFDALLSRFRTIWVSRVSSPETGSGEPSWRNSNTCFFRSNAVLAVPEVDCQEYGPDDGQHR